MNLPTILIGSIVLGVFVAIVASEVKKRRRGHGGCCGCCGSCAGCPHQH